MDPALNAHHLDFNPGDPKEILRDKVLYDISGIYRPIALRDQIIRSSIVVERAIEKGIIDKDRPLLIIGGGFAGMTAAFHAESHNIPTYLVELKKPLEKFTTLTRYVCPTLYDFPLSHWQRKEFPLETDSSIQIKIKAGGIDEITEYFQERIYEPLKKSKIFFLLESAEISKIALDNSGEEVYARVTVEIVDAVDKITKKEFTPKMPENFGMVISCIGFAKERTWVKEDDYKNGYVGMQFWQMDFELFNSGIKSLICGSGDGALQDFLLIVTGENSAHEIYEKLDLSNAIKSWIESNLSEAENCAHRSVLWTGGNSSDKARMREHIVYNELHQKYQATIEKLLGTDAKDGAIKNSRFLPNEINISDDERKKLLERLSALVTNYLEKGNHIQIIHSCTHFSPSYAMNKFLSLLIIEYIEQYKQSQKITIQEAGIALVKGIEHNCQGKAKICYLEKHEVKYIKYQCYEDFKSLLDDTSEEEYLSTNLEKEYDRVLVRFGLHKISSPFEKCQAPYNNCYAVFPGLQTLPYSFPKGND